MTDTHFPVVSIIMAAYNAERTIDESVRSVLAQSFADFELIIVDDCSIDGTLAAALGYASSDNRVRVFHNEENRGIHETRNRALKAASGKWIAICDSDDLWRSDKLERQLKRASESGSPLIFSASSFIDADGHPLDWVMRVPKTVSYKELLKQNIISNSSVLVDRALYEANQPSGTFRGISENDIHEDFACWLNMLKNGAAAEGIDEPLLIYRVSASSRTGNKFKSAVRTWKTYRYCGLSLIEAAAALCAYTVRGLRKYRSIGKA